MREGLARADWQKLGEGNNDRVVTLIAPFLGRPVEPLHRPRDGVVVLVTGCSSLRRSRRGRPWYRVGLLRIDGKTKPFRILLADEGREKAIELVQGDGNRKHLADGIRETTNDPLGVVGFDMLADNGPGEESK